MAMCILVPRALSYSFLRGTEELGTRLRQWVDNRPHHALQQIVKLVGTFLSTLRFFFIKLHDLNFH